MTQMDSSQPHNPFVFSRGSLQLTYDLLRPINPQLALTVRNLLHQSPVALMPDNKNAEHFNVTLDSFDVRAVVECISDCLQSPKNKFNQGMLIMAKALLEDWIALAGQMLADYQNQQEENGPNR